jgi:hypothetical protein
MAEPLRGSGSLAFALRPEWANLTTTVKNYALPSLFKPVIGDASNTQTRVVARARDPSHAVEGVLGL